MNHQVFVTRPSMPSLEEYVSEIRDIWESRWLTNMGSKHQQLQKNLVNYLGVENVDLLTNGHMALELSLQALNLQGEVITTPFTFASTTHAIVRNGLQPVFCDIKSTDFTIDENKIERLITEKTCAIMPVHVYGNVCAVEKIEHIAEKYGLKVIYDAAHAFGVRYKNQGIGNFGDVSCFSFHATKVFNSIEGGAVCFHDKNFGLDIYRLKNFGIRGPEVVDAVGANAKMNEFCAAMGICNLRHIDEEIRKRKALYERYVDILDGVEGIQLNIISNNVFSNYSYFPIVIDESKFGVNRDKVYDVLMNNGIFVRKYFYPLTTAFECFHGKYNVNETPVALRISSSVLTVPLYSELEFETVENICDIIKSIKK